VKAEIPILHIKRCFLISLISDLKKKNPHWGRQSVDDYDSTTRALFTEENTDGEI
jgi:hypothetical protein